MSARRYKVGNETKARILWIARELFYKNGFEKTTYNQISKKANVNIGSIVYHFKSLDNIAQIIYEEIIESRGIVIREKIHHIFPDKNFHKGILALCEYRINTDSYLAYPNYTRFVNELMFRSETWLHSKQNYSTSFISDYFNLEISENEKLMHKYLFLPFAAIATSAVHSKSLNLTSKEICHYQMRSRLLTIGVSEKDITKALDLVDDISDKIEILVDEHMIIS